MHFGTPEVCSKRSGVKVRRLWDAWAPLAAPLSLLFLRRQLSATSIDSVLRADIRYGGDEMAYAGL